jgi:hypothetical protein
MTSEHLKREIKVEDKQKWIILPGNSVFIQNFINKSIADYLFNELEKEIVYIPRKELKFRAPNGKYIPLPRSKSFYGTVLENGDLPIYRYGLDNYPNVKKWTKTLRIIRDLIERECNLNSNHMIVNRYENGGDYIGYHRDKTNSLKPNSKIVVLSLGENRTMDIQKIYRQANEKKTKKILELDMIHGSLFELTLETNRDHKHQIRKTKQTKKIRVSLTFRRVMEFMNIKTGKYYYKNDLI